MILRFRRRRRGAGGARQGREGGVFHGDGQLFEEGWVSVLICAVSYHRCIRKGLLRRLCVSTSNLVRKGRIFGQACACECPGDICSCGLVRNAFDGFVNLPRVRRDDGRHDKWSESSRRISGDFGDFAPRNEARRELFSIE